MFPLSELTPHSVALCESLDLMYVLFTQPHLTMNIFALCSSEMSSLLLILYRSRSDISTFLYKVFFRLTFELFLHYLLFLLPISNFVFLRQPDFSSLFFSMIRGREKWRQSSFVLAV